MDIMAEVIRSKRKSIAVQIKPDGAIVVRAPKWMKERDIEAFLQEKSAWIEKHRAAMLERQARMEQVEPYTESELCALKKTGAGGNFTKGKILRAAGRSGLRENRHTVSAFPLGELFRQRESEFQLFACVAS